ncbi:class I SAM-dependent methyltransferase [Rossellomorea marisflavi]|uniref:class I SAM-dependent methyltransferase n=1 Tax=Rossellomorea marisflavi TaxID=189381 RepID=UPI001EE2DEDB|nr:class I SAM-dependent methyltransferase [Rossellomorea marisflavi]UKS66418.1 class I SAM-dependent methyltransferase [Rossellomorea marisflavi]
MKTEFTGRASSYTKGRPPYPKGILELMRSLGADEQSRIADIGAGTGRLTRMLGELDAFVTAVEPSADMLEEYRHTCRELPRVTYMEAPAEETRLETGSVDFITVAQAFHWLDKDRCRTEFQRILKPGGRVLLIWNSMKGDDPFVQAYSNVLKDFTIKQTAGNASGDHLKEKREFFGSDIEIVQMGNAHTLDEEELIHHGLSLSYTPSADHPEYQSFINALGTLFREHCQEGSLTIPYETEVTIGTFQGRRHER